MAADKRITWSDPLQGMIQTAAQRYRQNGSLQLATRLPQTSSASVVTPRCLHQNAFTIVILPGAGEGL